MVSRYTEIEGLFLPEFLPNDNYAADNLVDEFFIREPLVNAGSFQWIPSPGNSATLSGSATAFDGKSISSYLWELVSGSGTITSNTSATTTVTALGTGFNVFKLTATDSDGVTSSGYIQVFVASINSARWNFTKTAFAVSGNNNMIAGASVVGSLSQNDSATNWKLLTNGGEWEPYLGSFHALNNGEGGSSAGSPTYTTFSADELQGAFLQAGHSTDIGGKYPMELHGLPAGTYKLYLIGSIKSSINANVPNGQFKVKFGASAETTQSIAQQSNYTTPALVFDGTLSEGEIIQFGPYTLTEGNGDATVFNCLFIEKIASSGTTYNDSLTESATASASESNVAVYPNTLANGITASDTESSLMTMVNSLSESVTPNESSTGGLLFISTLSESITPDTVISVIQTLVGSLSSSVTPGDSFTGVMILPNSLSQSITAGDGYVGGNIFESSLSSSVTVSDAISYLLQLNNLLSEIITANQSVSTQMVMGNILSETSTVDTTPASVQTMLNNLSEGLTVSDSITGGLLLTASLNESTTVDSIQGVFIEMLAIVNETVTGNFITTGVISGGVEIPYQIVILSSPIGNSISGSSLIDSASYNSKVSQQLSKDGTTTITITKNSTIKNVI